MTANIIYVVMIVVSSFIIGYLCGNNHKDTHQVCPKDSLVGAVRDAHAGAYYDYLVQRIYQKSHKCVWELTQVQRECLKGYALRASYEHIRRTDIRTQLIIKDMCK